jgi:hypothetical protein
MGGILDLISEEWFGAFPGKLSVHVIDSTRPQNLGNLFAAGEAADRIIVWDDDEVEKLQEERIAWEALTVSSLGLCSHWGRLILFLSMNQSRTLTKTRMTRWTEIRTAKTRRAGARMAKKKTPTARRPPGRSGGL